MPKTSEKVTQTLAEVECAKRGWRLNVTNWTERYPRPGGKFVTVKKDLLGFADGLVFVPSTQETPGRTIAIQWTTNHQRAEHIRKMNAEPRVDEAREAGWQVLLWMFDTKAGRLHQEIVADALDRRHQQGPPPGS